MDTSAPTPTLRSRLSKVSPVIWIILWSLLVHLPGITSAPLDAHNHRQVQTASMARGFFRHGMHFFSPELAGSSLRVGTEFPIYSYLLAILYQVFGEHEWLGRVLSAGFTAWSAVFLFRVVERRLGTRAGLWSALAMCSIPVHIFFTRTVQPEAMALWGMLGMAYFLDLWNEKKKFIYWILAVLLGALGPLLKIAFLCLVLGYWAVWAFTNRNLWRNWRLWMGPVLICGLCAGWYSYARTAPVQVLPIQTTNYFSKSLETLTTGLFWSKLFLSRLPETCFTYTGLLFGVVGFWLILRRKELFRSDLRVLLFGWWLVTFVYAVLCGQYGAVHAYTSIPWAPINGILMAVGMLSLWDRYKQFPIKKVIVILLVAAVPIHAGLRIKSWYRQEFGFLYRAKAEVARLTKPTDLFYTNVRDYSPVVLYYIDRYGSAGDMRKDGLAVVDKAIAHGARFALIPKDGVTRDNWPAEWKILANDPEFWIVELHP